MYQSALRQFLVLFDNAVTKSKPTHIIEKRITNILDFLTKSVWKYTNRGLYEQHKFLFTLLLALKIDLNNGQIQYNEFLIFLKGGASLDLNSVKVRKIFFLSLYCYIQYRYGGIFVDQHPRINCVPVQLLITCCAKRKYRYLSCT